MKMNNGTSVVLVTGANGAIGKAIALQIAKNHKYKVILACRSKEKARHAVEEIKRSTNNENVYYELVDLSSRSSIQALASRWQEPLHVLVNNAAVSPPSRQETREGFELQFATNVMGYFWMIEAFQRHLMQTPLSRIVNVASQWAGGLDINDLQFEHRRYDSGAAYRQSKQANRMLTVAFAERFKPHIAVNACHPGVVSSQLTKDLGFGGSETPDEGAKTPVWLATNGIGQEQTGKYFVSMQRTRCSFGEDRTSVETLYNTCLQLGK